MLPIVVIAVKYAINLFRHDKLKLLKVGSAALVAVLGLITISNVYAANRMPIILKAPESYIVEYNETKNVSDTEIKLKKVLLDLGSINATYSVRGREKVVGIELKKALEDITPIADAPGLWVGGKAFPAHEFIGMSYESKEIVTPLYLVFYLSNGDSAAFEIIDRAKAASAVKTVNINKTLNYGDNYINFTYFLKGLNYTAVAFESNFNPRDQVEIKLTADGVEIEEASSGWFGSGTVYQGSFGFDPINAHKVQLKITNFTLNRVDIIDINLE